MRTLSALLAAAAVLAAAAPAAAAIHFTADYTLTYSVAAHTEPDGTFVSASVPPVVYTGAFQFDLASASETVAAAGAGQQLRTLDAAFTFAPFDFAPDRLALVNAEALASLPLATPTSYAVLHAERLETTGGELISLQAMSNEFFFSENRLSIADGDIQSLYRSLRAGLDSPFSSVGAGIASTSPADIAAYFAGSTQFWSIGSDVSLSGPFFAPPTVHGGINFAGRLTFGEVTFVDDAAVVTPPGVPEPGTWALMIAGFGAAGSALRRRRISGTGYSIPARRSGAAWD